MSSLPESHLDLLDAPWATLATVDRDGRPQMSLVAFLAEDGLVRISLNTARAKTRHLMRNPAVALVIPDPAQPLRYLEIVGDAEVTPDADGAFVAKAGAKYGQDFTSYDRPGEARVIATIRPTRVYAADLSH